LVKWAFGVAPLRFVDLFDASLLYGVHLWKHTSVVPLAKPGKPDYSTPSAYHPISLLECCSKLLKRIVSRRLLDASNAFGILPPTQFGSHDYYCTQDATLCLTHVAQAAISAGKSTSVLLLDIKAFFDHIRGNCLVALLHLFGYPTSLCD
jgi:hypothetical protein